MVLAVTEIRRLGLYGLTASELVRYKQSALGEVAQSAAQSAQQGNEEVLGECFKYVALCGLCALLCSYFSVAVSGT